MPAPITVGDDQPCTGASMIDQSSRPSPEMERRAPSTSGRPACAFLELGMKGKARTRATAAMGTLIRKTEPQLKCASRRPPMIGPRATPAPVVAAQRPNARCRSRGSGYMLVMRASVEGMISAPPTPMLARAAISIPTDPEKAAQIEQPANATSPATKVHFRPKRSATLPDTSSRPAKTST